MYTFTYFTLLVFKLRQKLFLQNARMAPSLTHNPFVCPLPEADARKRAHSVGILADPRYILVVLKINKPKQILFTLTMLLLFCLIWMFVRLLLISGGPDLFCVGPENNILGDNFQQLLTLLTLKSATAFYDFGKGAY